MLNRFRFQCLSIIGNADNLTTLFAPALGFLSNVTSASESGGIDAARSFLRRQLRRGTNALEFRATVLSHANHTQRPIDLIITKSPCVFDHTTCLVYRAKKNKKKKQKNRVRYSLRKLPRKALLVIHVPLQLPLLATTLLQLPV